MTPAMHLVVPVLDEAPNLERLFRDFRATITDHVGSFDVRVLLVDDGSTDGTGRLAVELAGDDVDLTVLTHDVNQGPGRAFGTAFAHLASVLGPDDVVVTLEGDNTSRQEVLARMLALLRDGFDVVLASAYMYGGGIAHTDPYRVLVSHIGNAFVKEILRLHGLHTVSSFYRVHTAETVRRLQSHYGPRVVERAGFECAVELLMKLTYLGVSISEVPMVLDTSLRAGASKMRIPRTARGYVALSRARPRWRRAAGLAA